MNPDNLMAISRDLQQAFDAKDIKKVLEYYHPDIVLISPSSPKPLIGIEAFREAVLRQFASPQRTTVAIKEIKAYSIIDGVMAIICEIRGLQSIYYSSYEFNGFMTRIFLQTPEGPRIINEHFSLLNE